MHTYTGVVLMVADRYGFIFVIVVHFSHSIAGWAYNQRQPSPIAGSADSLSDWLVVSLPYSGVYCVNAGVGVIRSTE